MGKDAQQGYRVRFPDLAKRKKWQKMLLTDAESEKQRTKESEMESERGGWWVCASGMHVSRGSEKEL